MKFLTLVEKALPALLQAGASTAHGLSLQKEDNYLDVERIRYILHPETQDNALKENPCPTCGRHLANTGAVYCPFCEQEDLIEMETLTGKRAVTWDNE